ncbi:hypothetical protein GCM10011529_30710 [Polymorphobacter glacialis]|uniref:DUF1134 domain-containing protein n=1 Tax=Sandarakinorhabdus glacialis TaxID=1614636 RepID=A0A917A1F4_9SPHN|nr:DUF1134 domain-containing protein [Polymorphobacter glacialis]GGE21941.1 hypothetical protein GCM10011529_30710 [Polymorphobacter glacialis]
MRQSTRSAMLVLAAVLAMPAAAQTADVPVTETAIPPSQPAGPAAADAPPPLPVKAEPTFAEDDVLGAAEDVFGKGAEGLGELIRQTFSKYGQPNAYIVGREVSAAFGIGLRYGSGIVFHKIEGQQPVHWTGPSIGFDVGGDGSKTFALVYNLDDSEDLFRRYPAAEGKAYLVGGFTANYLQRDNVIIVPVKLGVGARLGINAGYLKFTHKGQIVPF